MIKEHKKSLTHSIASGYTWNRCEYSNLHDESLFHFVSERKTYRMKRCLGILNTRIKSQILEWHPGWPIGCKGHLDPPLAPLLFLEAKKWKAHFSLHLFSRTPGVISSGNDFKFTSMHKNNTPTNVFVIVFSSV